MTEENFEDNLGWKAFVELRRQVQCSAAAGMSETEVDAEIAAYRSRKEQSAK
jgi:DNA-damage-inducible protein J